MKNYETKYLETKRLIIDKGNSEASKKIYEYDLIKCTGIDEQNELIKLNQAIDFIGENTEKYYEECVKNKIFDWYVYLKEEKIPVANIIADRENQLDKSIEISYNTHPDHWGKGYIPEALKEIFKYLKEIGYKKIIIHFYNGNIKSKRVCEKLQFKHIGKTEKLYKPTNKMIYENEYVLYLE